MCGDDFKGSALKILFVAPYLPSPPLSGGQRRLEGLIRGLSARHEVSLLCFAESDPGETREYCHQLVTVDFDSRGVAVSRRRLLQLRSLVSIRSFEHRLFRQPDVQVRLDQLLSSNSYDVIQVEFCQMAGHEFPSGNSQRPLLVLDEHNIEYDVIRRTSEGTTAFGRRIYHEINWRKLKREELSVWKRFDGVVVTSDRDERLLKRDDASVRTAVVPNGVDLTSFTPSGAPADPCTLLFVGVMNYFPNTDGVTYFVREVLPAIRAVHPDVRLKIVGMNPPESVKSLADSHIEVTDVVDDPRPYLDSSTVVIVPLRVGGGTRFKILEAMAKGKPIVSTRIGAEGIEAEHDRELLLADDAESFAREVGRLLTDPKLAKRLGRAGRQLAEQRYSWESAVTRLEAFYGELGEL